jgi:F-type H+-transporting ATPase subunit epsilon
VLPAHAPVISMLRPGVMRVIKDGATLRFMVLGGFAEVSPAGLTILADIASSADEVDAARLAAYIKELEETIAQMEQGSALDREITRLDHVRTVQAELAAPGAGGGAAH